MTDFGSDFTGVDDLDPAMLEVSGLRALVESLGRRFSTREGSLLDDPSYGYDLRQLLNAPFSPGFVSARSEQECLKEERVTGADVNVAFDALTQTVTAVIAITPSNGPAFSLTITVSKVTTALLLEVA